MMKGLILLSILMPMACYGAMVGGLTDIQLDANDANVQFAVGAINAYKTKLGDTQDRTLVQVVKAQSQVVAGVKYVLTLRVTTGSQEELCKVSVWSRPWLSGDDATQLSEDPVCNSAAARRALVGGENPIAPESAEVQDALNFAVQTMNAQENSLYLRKATKIEKVTSQVVSGIAYHFYGVQMASTDCTKGSTSVENCNVADGANTHTCDFVVWWQSWMTPKYRLQNLNCQ